MLEKNQNQISCLPLSMRRSRDNLVDVTGPIANEVAKIVLKVA